MTVVKMSEISEFLAMGGYGGYIWSAYAITFVVLLANVLLTQRAYQKAKQLVVRRSQQRKTKHS
jgi:heme exporter protein D